eukprot:gene1067-1352_t
MPNIKEIVGRIHSVQSTQQITKAMKMVAAAKLAKAQHRLSHVRPYVTELNHMLHCVACHVDPKCLAYYTQKRPLKKLLLVVISADKGLCGSFNANITKKAEGHIRFHDVLLPNQIDILAIGKKSLDFFQKKEYNLVANYVNLANTLHFEDTRKATSFMINAFLNHAYDRIELVYNLFGSAASQHVQLESFLPLEQPMCFNEAATDYLYEPSKGDLLEALIPMNLHIQLYQALLESNASEHGARMTTMSKATENAEELLKELRITYNKTRQAAITNELSEIVAGAETRSPACTWPNSYYLRERLGYKDTIMRHFLQIAYQGTHYHGWQMQHNATTIQGILQDALSQLLSTQILIVGSSRTDTGVHAQQQFAHVDFPFSVDIDKLQYRLNAILPPDIAISAIHPVAPTAHARFDALSRSYVYKIARTKNPFMQTTTYVLRHPLDLEMMNKAARILKTYQNFESFSKIGSVTEHSKYPYQCNIMEAQWVEAHDLLTFHITANRFLRGMVRSVVGNLLQVGLHQCTLQDFEHILVQKNRNLSASLAPACGLTLSQVTYDAGIFIGS